MAWLMVQAGKQQSRTPAHILQGKSVVAITRIYFGWRGD
jgi:hypothetical protein